MKLICAILFSMAVLTTSTRLMDKKSPSESPSTDCSTIIYDMMDCISFLTEGSKDQKPSSTCCTGLESVLSADPKCLCVAIKTSKDMGIDLNLTRADALPKACGVSAPPLSKCDLTKPPSGAPGKAPSNSPAKPPSGGKAPSNSPAKPPSGGKAPSDSPAKPPSSSKAPSDSPAKPPSSSKAPSDSPAKPPSSSKAPSDSPTKPPSASKAPSPTKPPSESSPSESPHSPKSGAPRPSAESPSKNATNAPTPAPTPTSGVSHFVPAISIVLISVLLLLPFHA